jgi:hypothetical protein
VVRKIPCCPPAKRDNPASSVANQIQIPDSCHSSTVPHPCAVRAVASRFITFPLAPRAQSAPLFSHWSLFETGATRDMAIQIPSFRSFPIIDRICVFAPGLRLATSRLVLLAARLSSYFIKLAHSFYMLYVLWAGSHSKLKGRKLKQEWCISY